MGEPKPVNFRHELKYLISSAEVTMLRTRLSGLISLDAHAKNGHYTIRSLYFDNLADRALREKIDGVNSREKFRVRYYNGDTSFILLEKKSKCSGLCSKVQATLTRRETQAIAAGEPESLAESTEPLVRELYQKMRTQGLKPKTIVDYTREPFVFAPGNVRVTLDYHIRTGLGCTDFLDPGCVTVPIRDDPIILEVKWDSFLPSVIRDIVQIPGTHTSAFSKYAACRVYG